MVVAFAKSLVRPLYTALGGRTILRVVRHGWGGRHDHLGFPQTVHIENTNLCPARSAMCAMDKMKRKTGTMDFDLFRKIADECALCPRHVREVHRHGFGEPLLDNLLAEKIRYAKQRTRAFTYIVTTGNILTEKMARNIILAGLDGIKFSLYGDTAQTYESIHRRLKFEKTVAAVEMFLRVRDERKAPNPLIRMQVCGTTVPKDEQDSWAKRWGPKLDASRGDVLLRSSLHNWVGAGEGDEHRTSEAERFCSWPFRHIQILWDGRVSPCVFDFDGTTILGDLQRQSVREVWLSESYEAFRNVWRSRKWFSIAMCKRCDSVDGRFRLVPIEPDALQLSGQAAPREQVMRNLSELQTQLGA